MKMQVIAKEDIHIYLKNNKGRKGAYSEIYEVIDGLEPGKALVVQFDDAKKATAFASVISSHIIYDKKHNGRFKNCYYTKSLENVIVGKN